MLDGFCIEVRLTSFLFHDERMLPVWKWCVQYSEGILTWVNTSAGKAALSEHHMVHKKFLQRPLYLLHREFYKLGLPENPCVNKYKTMI